jgi:hypothetical protein
MACAWITRSRPHKIVASALSGIYSIGLMSTLASVPYELAAISRQIMVWKLIQLRLDRCASLDAILSVLRDTESA